MAIIIELPVQKIYLLIEPPNGFWSFINGLLWSRGAYDVTVVICFSLYSADSGFNRVGPKDYKPRLLKFDDKVSVLIIIISSWSFSVENLYSG